MNNYWVKWEANGNTTHGKLGPFTSKVSAIKNGRNVVVGNQLCGGASGGFDVELHNETGKTVVFAETVTVRADGSVRLLRNRVAEGLSIKE